MPEDGAGSSPCADADAVLARCGALRPQHPATPGGIERLAHNRCVPAALPYLPPIEAPTRAEVDAFTGPVLLEFGTDWCGHCRGAQPLVAAALAAHPGVRHVKVEDGPGRALGRSFIVKRWPTLVALRDGQELARLVRPADVAAIGEALDRIDPPAA